MDLVLYKKAIDDMLIFPQKIKMLRFCGVGESLLNKNIVEMVEYAHSKNIAEKIELITNGVLLNKKISAKLIEAGLSALRVSIYGLSSKTYKEVSQKNVNFEKIVDNVKNFYNEKKRKNANVSVYVKTMDCSLENEEERIKFIQLFREYCDKYAVESVAPFVKEIDYSSMIKNIDKNQNISGMQIPKLEICPQLYHLITIHPDGKVVPCCNIDMYSIGDVSKQPLANIWQSQKLLHVQKHILDGVSSGHKDLKICKECSFSDGRLFPEDYLDADVDKIKKRYERI